MMSQNKFDDLTLAWLFTIIMSGLGYYFSLHAVMFEYFMDGCEGCPPATWATTNYTMLAWFLMGFTFISASISSAIFIWLFAHSSYVGFEDKLVDWIWKKNE